MLFNKKILDIFKKLTSQDTLIIPIYPPSPDDRQIATDKNKTLTHDFGRVANSYLLTYYF